MENRNQKNTFITRTPLILASASPRRQELLRAKGIPFTVCPSQVSEERHEGETPYEYALRLACDKALDVARKRPGLWILGADTVVEVDGRALGKPRDAAEAGQMLHLLSGRDHQVITAFAVVDGMGQVKAREAAISRVTFKRLRDEEILAYIASGEPFDKAGGYAVQGLGAALVKRVEGSYTNVVGLPIKEVTEKLKELGIVVETSETMTEIAAHYRRVVEAVAEAAQRCGRNPQEITLVAAAKTKGADEVRAAIAAGAQDIGENYVQEAQAKMEAIGEPIGEPVRWHLIGHLQRNKARVAVRLFALIQSLDSLELARELNRQGEKLDRVVRTLVEVNLAGEKTKSGINKEALRDLLEELRVLPFLRVEGLMTVPPYSPNPEDSRPYFRELAQLRQEHAALGIAQVDLRELSMGMTEDYPVAIEEGATIVRIGRAIFGERP